MKVYRGKEEPAIVKPLDDSEDKSKTIVSGENNGNSRPTKDERRSDDAKELIAEDVLTLGAREAALVHGVSEKSALAYSKGDGVGEEARARILTRRYDIENVAVTKLMDTLNLLDPNNVDKEKDRVAIMTGLAKVIDTVSEKGKLEGSKVLHLHLYDPGRKKESDYEVIDVGATK